MLRVVVAFCVLFFVSCRGLMFVVACVDGYWMLVWLCVVFMASGCWFVVDVFGCCCCLVLFWVYCCWLLFSVVALCGVY